MSGACPGRIPRYPSAPGICSSSTCSFTTSFSGVTISSWKVSAIRSTMAGSDPSTCERLESKARFLRRLLHLLGSFQHFFNRPLHVESLFGDIVVLTFHNVAESFYRIRDLHVTSRGSRELLRHVERLRQEALHFASSSDGQLLVFAQFVDTKNCDDVLQVFISLERLLHHLRYVVVLLPHDARIENARRRSERIDSRINS